MDIFAQRSESGWVILLILQRVKNYNKTHKGSVRHLTEYWNWLHPGYPVSPLTILPARNWMRRGFRLAGHVHTWPAEFPKPSWHAQMCTIHTPLYPGLALWISSGNTEPHDWDNFLYNRMWFSCSCGVRDWKIWWWNLRMFPKVPIHSSVFLKRNTNKIFYHWNALI